MTDPGEAPAFRVLFEAEGMASMPQPEEVTAAYGRLALGSPGVYANFVSSLDGVAAFEPAVTEGAGDLLSGRNPADRFLMGLLRACADGILVGAGTLRAEARHTWAAGSVYPPAARLYAELRGGLGLQGEAQLYVASASGRIDPGAGAFRGGARVITTSEGLRRLPRELRDGALAFGAGSRLDLAHVVHGLRGSGCGRLLTEGVPSLMAELLRARCVDELFLTLSPVLAGRAAELRPGLVQGRALLPGAGAWARLLSVRRVDAYLFLRYALRETAGVGAVG